MKVRQIYEKSESEMTVVWFGSAGCKLDKITAVDLVFTNASDLSYNGQQFNLSESATSNSYVDIAKNEVTDLDFGSMTVTFFHYGDEQAQKFYLKKKEVLVLALMYLIKKIYVSIVSIAAAYILWVILIKIKLVLILPLFSVSIICYLIMLMEKSMILEIEEKYNNKKTEVQ